MGIFRGRTAGIACAAAPAAKASVVAAGLTALAGVLTLAACGASTGTSAGSSTGTAARSPAGTSAGSPTGTAAGSSKGPKAAGIPTDFSVHAQTLPPYGSHLTISLRPGAPISTRPPDPCAGGAAGLRVTAGPVDGAMGLRALTVTLTNCGTASLIVRGYPDLRPLDAAGNPLKDIAVHHGIEVTTGIPDPAPATLTLRHGRQVTADLAWRNLVTDPTVTATAAAAFAVVPAPGEPPQVIHETLDIGNTGRIDTTAWHRPST